MNGTTKQDFINSYRLTKPPGLISNDVDELTLMNNLNSRFMNFINLVKSETNRCEDLKASLIEQKQIYFSNFTERNAKYYNDLTSAKKTLNDLCLGLSKTLIKERNNRILIDWFSKMVQFENNNMRNKSRLQINLNNMYTIDLSNRLNEDSPNDNHIGLNFHSSSLNELNNVDSSPYDQNLCNLSHISGSESSLLSTSSSITGSGLGLSLASSSASPFRNSQLSPSSMLSDKKSDTSPFLTNANTSMSTTANSNYFSEPSSFSLETYLNSLSQAKLQLQLDFDRKQSEIVELKENVESLNSNLSDLNDNLDQVKFENISLNENVKSLKKEIEFYRKLKEENKMNNVIDSRQNSNHSNSNNEIEKIKKELREEFEEFNQQQLDEYEDYLVAEFHDECEIAEIEYNQQAEAIENESNLVLDELIDLNKDLEESVTEYEGLYKINFELNERLIKLSDNLCSFSRMDADHQEQLIASYTNKSLERKIEEKRNQIKELKAELATIKNKYIERDLSVLVNGSLNKIDASDILNDSVVNDDKQTQNSNLVNKQKLNGSKKNLNTTIDKTKQEKQKKIEAQSNFPIKLRPYYAEIEYTKSNLFAYLVVKFDLINNNVNNNNNNINNGKTGFKPNTANSINSSKSSNSLNSLKIVHDSIDGHSIILENSHKILDFDLSEWTIRREVYNTVTSDFISSHNLDLENLNVNNANKGLNRKNFTSVTDLSKLINNSKGNIEPAEVIQYKFPKGFKLKRRKKVNLIAAGANLSESISNINDISLNSKKGIKTKSSFSCNSLNELNNRNLKSAFSMASLVQHANSPAPNANKQNLTRSTSNSLSITKAKCACCSCKMMTTTRKGDVEILEVHEVNNWGSDLLVKTLFINNKNITKLINFKILKHIWVNNHQE